jgi:hypothetical protein
VSAEAQEFKITNQSTADQAIVAREHTPHLVEEQLPGHATPRREALLEPKDERAKILPRKELHPERRRIPEHREQRTPHGSLQWAKSTWAWCPAGVSKRTTGAVTGVWAAGSARNHLGIAAAVARGANLRE